MVSSLLLLFFPLAVYFSFSAHNFSVSGHSSPETEKEKKRRRRKNLSPKPTEMKKVFSGKRESVAAGGASWKVDRTKLSKVIGQSEENYSLVRHQCTSRICILKACSFEFSSYIFWEFFFPHYLLFFYPRYDFLNFCFSSLRKFIAGNVFALYSDVDEVCFLTPKKLFLMSFLNHCRLYF